jgi:hypothetical protein
MRGEAITETTGVNVQFVFGHESLARHTSNCRAFCYPECQRCGSTLIEIYVDRILTWSEAMVFFGEGENNGIAMLAWRIHVLLLHELTHWAEYGESDARAAEEFADDFLPRYLRDPNAHPTSLEKGEPIFMKPPESESSQLRQARA